MLVGHIAVGLVTKRVEPRISLGTAVLAATLMDLLWAVFMLAGLEHVRFTSGLGAANYLVSYDTAYSHSLLMNVLWAALFAVAYYWRGRCPRGAWVLFVAVVSHWLLDLIAHRPDMPLAPGTHRYFGFGLWTSVPATIAVEGGFWLMAITLYLRATRPINRWGLFVFWIAILVMTLAWYNNIAGPPPPSPQTAPIASLVFFSLIVAWAYWMNRLRPARPPIRAGDAPRLSPPQPRRA